MLNREVHRRYVLQENATSGAQQPGMKVVYSHLLAARPGDIALTYGLEAFQVEALLGIETNEAWVNYYESYRNRVNNSIKRLMPVKNLSGTASSAGYRESFRRAV